MVEYTVYLATASGVLMLRFRHPAEDNDRRRGIYLAPIFNPIAFSCVATLIVIRSAIAHMLQGLAIVLIFGIGSLIYRSNWWRKLVIVSVAIDLE
jgi:amino acid transporter